MLFVIQMNRENCYFSIKRVAKQQCKDASESEVGTDTPECDESKSFFLDLHGLSAKPVNLV